MKVSCRLVERSRTHVGASPQPFGGGVQKTLVPELCPRNRPQEVAIRKEDGTHLGTGVRVDGREASKAGSSHLKGAEIGDKEAEG